MNIDIDVYKKVTGNDELLGKLEGLWNGNAPLAQLVQAIEDAGIKVEADQVEELLTQVQAKRASVIALDEVDEEQLKKVAGGSGEEDDGRVCVDSFFCYQTINEQCTENLYQPCDAYTAVSL